MQAVSELVISGWAGLSAIGMGEAEVLGGYLEPATCIDVDATTGAPKAAVTAGIEDDLGELQKHHTYRNLDRSTQLAILCGRKLMDGLSWKGEQSVGINIGSSRGATSLLEIRPTSNFLKRAK